MDKIVTETESVSMEQYDTTMFLKQLKNMAHQDSSDCWCFPTLMFVDPDTGMSVYKHYFPH